ncbi:hypothetical protein GOP47_0003775 [Adiantum capillus-veneris]|uniref:BZIP domain-containing protein n=1 Tax=Adiantum capillus-veneris TaxID=13818 RepID=A0A9D4V7Y7_ADICA|nr:hypothetical protein GOP47_0003775 [Adiantum capillus-veneris]
MWPPSNGRRSGGGGGNEELWVRAASFHKEAREPKTEGAVQAECLPSSGSLKATSSITRQASIYSLTLDEFQNALGEPTKSFGSMNMDEFLRNIWTVEESQAMAAAMGGAGGNTDELHPQFQQSIQRQASISLPRTLSRKTVDDVWKDITRDGIDMGSDSMSGAMAAGAQDRQVTFGEMTLEDFLVKAGVVKKDDHGIAAADIPLGMSFDKGFGAASSNRPAEMFLNASAAFGGKGTEGEKVGAGNVIPITLSLAGSNLPASQGALEPMQVEAMNHASPVVQQSEWLSNNGFKTEPAYPLSPRNMLHQHVVEVSARNGMLGSPQSPLLDGIGPPYESMGIHTPLPYGALEGGIVRGRKREFEGSLERVVERRQKRMIKNRESAARSRARKQAYTVELEAEVSHLKEENLRLRRHEEEMAERRRKQLIDVLTSFGSPCAPKACKLRRTHTGPW